MTPIAWHGWNFKVPDGWNPLRLEGDYNRGQALFVDLERPRLALRWQALSRRDRDPDKMIGRALRDEIGQLAADEAREHALPAPWEHSRLYLEPKPPGRNVWIALSRTSNRLLQIIQHTQRADSFLVDTILPHFCDSDRACAMPWSIFELSCIAPAGMNLKSQRLLAGDLSLMFVDKRSSLTVRQIAVAELALARKGLEKWLAEHHSLQHKHYMTDGKIAATEGKCMGRLRRRLRFCLHPRLPLELFTCALHDKQRDRLVFLECSDECMLDLVAQTVGWAQRQGDD